MSGEDRHGRRRVELGSDGDAMTLLSRALDIARRRLLYRIGAGLMVAATLVAAVVLVR